MWAVTAYYNPQGCVYRLRNYEAFRRALPLPLCTVEVLLPGQPPTLTDAHAEHVVRVVGDCMWQKERALNLGVAALPGTCQKFLTVDADLVYPRTFDMSTLEALLDRTGVVQAYRTVAYLHADQSRAFTAPGFVWAAQTGGTGDVLPAPGGAWAFRRDMFERFQFYDRCIVGGADTGAARAFVNAPGVLAHLRDVAPLLYDDFLHWRKRASDVVQGAVGWLPCDIVHLWHGDVATREYVERHTLLRTFDPQRDIDVVQDTALQWSAGAAAPLREAVASYLTRRACSY
jgi:hypothetical protein